LKVAEENRKKNLDELIKKQKKLTEMKGTVSKENQAPCGSA